MKRRPARAESGYTLIELIISLTLLAVITSALVAAFITTNNANANVSERIHESNDAQVISGFWTADAQAAGGVDPARAATDTSLGVSKTDDGGCGLGGGTLVTRFKWKEWVSRDPATTADTFTTRVANYVYRSSTAELERRTCANGTSTGVVSLATRVASAPTVTCDGSPSCPSLPSTVSITVTETNNPTTAPTPYKFTLSATVRPTGQTAPGAGSAAGSPLLALGTGTCSGGAATGMSVAGNTTVVVNGQAAINAADVGGCTAMTANGSIQYSANGTSLVPGGSCSGNQCPPTTTDATRIGDPFASLPAPGSCSGGGGNPAAGQPGTYHNAATISGALATGVYIFCNTVSFSGSVTGTGVMLYLAGASSAFNLSGGTNIDLKAPTSGAYAGLLIWNATTNAVSMTGNGSVANYNGALYSPNADVTVAGTSSTYIGMIVAKRIFFSGNHTTDITNGSVTPGAPPLTATTGPGLRQVHLHWDAPGYTGAIGFPITGYEYRVDSGGGYGPWTTVPGGAAVTDLDHTCGSSDTVPTTCTYQVRALNGQGAGNASAPASAASLADGTGPVVTITSPTAGGYTSPVTTFSGAAGNATGDATTVAVKVWSATGCAGTLLQTLSAPRVGTTWTVNSAALAYGAKSVCATQTDWAGNTGTAGPANFTVGQVTNVVLANGGTLGRADKGDTVTITFGQAMNAATLCTGWNGTTARSSTTVIVTITNNDAATNGNDSLTVTDTTCPTFNFGKIDLGTTAWVAGTTSFSGNSNNASSVVFDATLKVLTVKLGSGTGSGTGVPAQTVVYAPSTAMKDSVGNAMSGSYTFPGQRF